MKRHGTRHWKPHGKRRCTAAVLGLLLGLGTATAGAPAGAPEAAAAGSASAAPDASVGPVVAALERAARPLRTVEPQGDGSRDLRPVGSMIGEARVVGVGEATHSSHDFFALKHRLFRHLVEEKGFRTFALEASWSTGLRLNAYVLHGTGDVRRIMKDEFQGGYLWWNNTEYLRLIEWMRAYNVRHPHDPVRFMGDDMAWSGPELYDAVTGYVARAYPELSARLDELYRGLRPTVATGTYLDQYLKKPYGERKEMAERTGRALQLLESVEPREPVESPEPVERQAAGHAGRGARGAYERAVQNARVIDQTARQYAYDFEDPAQVAASMRYRDAAMAANVVWWQRHTGTKVLLSAHGAHVAYETRDPANYPKVQGAFLRDSLGSGYVSVGLTFEQGSFNATGPDGAVHRWALGPAGPGSNERTLDRVRYRDYAVDLRAVGAPARGWLAAARPTRSIGTDYPDGPYTVALGRSHDVLIHLHRVEAASLRDRPVSSALGPVPGQ
ncbi:thiazole biosynthesis protein [Streptomyces sp. NBRC 110611]|uniref:erythromycin esterase family protein n=1 Tax=Streptomyces sp. NBRC 110611 TaxID=1621259 RepID=UPI00083005F7|nr:erythromycin esterase family protein [Streptomyces sp. NBRC 110611]GAU66910.1 thiazole biosynthesis protein [Streptomyces sp. NBRC 110611]